MKCRAYGKINWILDIVGIKDGFHMLDGVMETIGIYDEITVTTKEEEGVKTTYKNIPTMKGDLCQRAGDAFYKQSGIKGGADIYVEKNIPMGAGLGGGSSDCCAVLCMLNSLYNNPLNDEEIFDIAQSLGADVAFFIKGGAQRARGKGEILDKVERNADFDLIIARPKGRGVSTPAAFKLYDSMEEKVQGDVEKVIDALEKGDVSLLASQMYNALEKPSIQLLPDIEEVTKALMESGAIRAMMTGSGSAVIGLLGNKDIDEDKLSDFWWRRCKTVKFPLEIVE